MKDKHTQMWIPLYVDKWIFGSTRIELEPAERSVFVDLLAFGAKDQGYIRANETTAYPHTQLAGLLNISVELLQSTIVKCLHFDKLIEKSPGIYRLKNWEEYQLSKSYISELENGVKPMPGLGLRTKSSLERTKGSTIREEKIREEKIEEDNTTKGIRSLFDFEAVWGKYPNKDGKKASEAHFRASVKTQEDYDNLNRAIDNYLKSEKPLKGFIKNGSTFFNNWRDWVDYISPTAVPKQVISRESTEHFNYMKEADRLNAFHDKNTAGGVCAYCGAKVQPMGICGCFKYTQEYSAYREKVKGDKCRK